MHISYKKVFSAVGFLLGTATIAAAAGTWTAAPANPPTGNVEAPVNVSSIAQAKPGLLGLTELLATRLNTTANTAVGGTAPAYGNILMSLDAQGTAKWVATSTLGVGGGGGSATSTFTVRKEMAITAVNGQIMNFRTNVPADGKNFCWASSVTTGGCDSGSSYAVYPVKTYEMSTPAGKTGKYVTTVANGNPSTTNWAGMVYAIGDCDSSSKMVVMCSVANAGAVDRSDIRVINENPAAPPGYWNLPDYDVAYQPTGGSDLVAPKMWLNNNTAYQNISSGINVSKLNGSFTLNWDASSYVGEGYTCSADPASDLLAPGWYDQTKRDNTNGKVFTTAMISTFPTKVFTNYFSIRCTKDGGAHYISSNKHYIYVY